MNEEADACFVSHGRARRQSEDPPMTKTGPVCHNELHVKPSHADTRVPLAEIERLRAAGCTWSELGIHYGVAGKVLRTRVAAAWHAQYHLICPMPPVANREAVQIWYRAWREYRDRHMNPIRRPVR
jgi:hypothetical protein